MHLALYLEAGTHLGGWRLPESATSGGVDWALYKTVARRKARRSGCDDEGYGA